MSIERLHEALDDIDASTAPDRWAVAAYRLAVARAESATRPADLARDVELLERAGRILTARRAPVEHARVLVAIGSCRRLQGAPAAAVALFEQAIELQRGRAAYSEVAASTIDLGMALVEAGRPNEAIAVFDTLLAGSELAASSGDGDEYRRLRGAALLDRAQAHHACGSSNLAPAIADYRAAIDCFDAEAPQRGLAHHGLGAALLAIGGDVSEAIRHFETSARILAPTSFPLQHAIARHSLAVAHERRAGPRDLALGIGHAEAALTMFDPRLHAEAWRATADTLGRLAVALDVDVTPEGRAAAFIDLIDGLPADERARHLRDRLGRLSGQPPQGRRREVLGLATAAVQARHFDSFVRDAIPILMELPDDLLADACAAFVVASRSRPDLARDLDDAVHDLLFGPQRVRVRDLLVANGWTRP